MHLIATQAWNYISTWTSIIYMLVVATETAAC